MKKSDSLLGATLSVSLLAILVKSLGFFREALIAAYYGATAETDAFFFAEGMPTTFFPAVSSGLALAFASLYVQKAAEEGEEESDRYASRMLLASTLLGVFLGILGAALAPVLVPLFAPGFSGGQRALAVRLTRLIMGAFVLTMLQYMQSAILNSKKRFLPPQAAALAHNAVIVGIVVLLGRGRGMTFLMMAVIAGMLAQVLVLLSCCRGQIAYTRGLGPFHPDTWRLFRLALPILLGNSIVQLNSIVDKALGSTLPEGSLSALNYANDLTAFVISVFITSLATTIYPTLAAEAAEGSERFGETLLQGMGGLTLVLIPISCITSLDAGDIVSVVYARGSFDQAAVSSTALALAWYAPMFAFSGLRDILTRAFYAVQDTKTPMRNGAIGVGCNIISSLLFVRWLGLKGIALGTTVSAAVTAALLLSAAHRRLPGLDLRPFFLEAGRGSLAGAALSAVLRLFRRAVPVPWPMARFAMDTILGLACYSAILAALGSTGIGTAAKRIGAKIRGSGHHGP
ncbi:murein biosynthesis integral membrane protein MurJ [uncultured Oscillibacter sp.]|uniref:murein biosynthesis integral membrane protein MurJ n=1 Tax=uncultured Oscillibacter sp. TaxID=876091 RepID=UPI0025F6D211|nr:murein biosynthesis integral membrane protein MurJ [uncultured Oscillibacter sp.]